MRQAWRRRGMRLLMQTDDFGLMMAEGRRRHQGVARITGCPAHPGRSLTVPFQGGSNRPARRSPACRAPCCREWGPHEAEGKIALITGGATALRFAREGANLVRVGGSGRDRGGGSRGARPGSRGPPGAGRLRADEAQVAALAKAALDAMGRVDVLVRGVAIHGAAATLPTESWDLNFWVNVRHVPVYRVSSASPAAPVRHHRQRCVAVGQGGSAMLRAANASNTR